MELLLTYAMMHVGTPYKWGGSDPIHGYDCSGFVQELLISGGAHPDNGRTDYTSQGLYNYFAENGRWNKRLAGSLAFYGRDRESISHVALLIDPWRVIEAAGGGSSTTNIERAAEHDAFIRIRPLGIPQGSPRCYSSRLVCHKRDRLDQETFQPQGRCISSNGCDQTAVPEKYLVPSFLPLGLTRSR